MRDHNPFRSAMSLYDLALEQVRKSPADLTDEQLETLRLRNPEFAKMAAAGRERHRNSAAFQQRLAEAEYFKNTDRQRLAARLGVSPGASEKKRVTVVRMIRR